MNLHEYQGKSILKSFGVRIQEGLVASSPEEAVEAAKKLNAETGTEWWVVKAQIHAGGRGKGTIVGTDQHGVAIAKSLDDVKRIAGNILGGALVTKQTGENGKLVNRVLIAQDVYYPGASEPSEYYMGVLLNRQTGRNMIMYSTEGGMDIETVAERNTSFDLQGRNRSESGIDAISGKKDCIQPWTERRRFQGDDQVCGCTVQGVRRMRCVHVRDQPRTKDFG